jgi:hypothetical protein
MGRKLNHRGCFFRFMARSLLACCCLSLAGSLFLLSKQPEAEPSLFHHDGDPSFHKPLAGLSCEAFGGPLDAADVREMIYWHDIPSDSRFMSPLKKPGVIQYLTFEPDGGGFNNM